MTGTDARLTRGAKTVTDGFRPDIEGLRAVAIGLVLVYHAGLSVLPGGYVGVDVFFVISGFLITGLLVRELERDGRVSMLRFYARRAKRLLPATAVVLVVTAVLTRVFLPVTQRETFGGDIVGAALYLVNWRFADRSVDYLAEDVGPSPVLHFWSLAVEEQFYVVWPVLLLVVGWIVRRSARAQVRPVMAAALVLVAVPSLLWSVRLTEQSPATAFFVTTTRLWELAVGAAVAIGVALWPRVPRPVAVLLGWAGLAAIGASGLVYSDATQWPGTAALLPTLGAAAVIIAGSNAGGLGPASLLAHRSFVWVGGLSYSLYLWHWPLVVVAEHVWGDLGGWRGVAVIAVSFVPAWLSLKLVENPVRFSSALSASPRLALSLGGNFTAVGAAAGLAVILTVPVASGPPVATQDAEPNAAELGAQVLADDPEGDPAGEPVDSVEWMTPDPLQAEEDLPAVYEEDCQVPEDSAELAPCVFGDPDGEVRVAVVGDSKIAQWQTPLAEIAADHGWRLEVHTKSFCAFSESVVSTDGAPYETCAQWNDSLLAHMTEQPFDAVITSQGRATGYPPDSAEETTREAMIEGLRARWAALDELGTDVAVVLDNPFPQYDDLSVYECVAEHPQALTACAFDREEGLASSAAETLDHAAAEADNATVVDLNAAICPTASCAPVIGNVLIYRQGSHITDTYAQTMRPRLERELVPVVEGALE